MFDKETADRLDELANQNKVTAQDLDTTLRVLTWVLQRTRGRRAHFYRAFKDNGYQNDYNDYQYWKLKEKQIEENITHVQENRYLYVNSK
jgi:hypothetical protein